jgi:phosphoribosylformylglycinamidine cyclo-ligase
VSAPAGGTARPPSPPGLTYAAAGVDTAAGDRAVELMKDAVARTHGPRVLGGLGGFAGLWDASDLVGMRRPLLATSTDGVGTKVAVAQAMSVHDTVGVDLVGMVVDDIVVCGARPLFMTDYVACGRVVPERIAALVAGIARGCAEVGCALVGGETAEHPGLLAPDEYDLAGAATGVVEADDVLGPDRVRPGDVVVAMASSGLHANGYSLVRRVLSDAGWDYGRHVDDLGRTVGEELLEPTRLYTPACLELAALPGGVHAFAHVTGGGLAANLARVLPPGTTAVLERSTWTPPAMFALVRDLGGVPAADLEGTLNLGVGMVAVVPADAVPATLAALAARGVAAWVAGEVRADDPGGEAPDRPDDVTPGQGGGAKGVRGGRVELVGAHPGW